MDVTLTYAGQDVALDLRGGELATMISLPPAPAASLDLASLIERAIENPVGTPPLGRLAGPGKRVAVLFDDGSRPTPTSLLFPLVEKELLKCGVSSDHIYPVHAPGLHRMPARYLQAKAGELLKHPNLVMHDEHKSRTVFRGVTTYGNPIFVNDIVERVDLVMSIGNIVPHMDAGYGGGGKIVLPGISAKPTVEQNHSFFTSPTSRMRITDGNPAREDMDQAGRLAGLDFIVNTITDLGGRIADVVAGDAIAAHRQGVACKEEICGYWLDEPVDIAVAAGDNPFLIGTMGMMMLAELAVRPGGSLILASPCSDGWSPPDMLEVGMHPPLEYMRRSMAEMAWMVANRGAPENRLSAWIFDYRRVMEEKHVYLVNRRFDRSDVESFGMHWAPDIQSAFDAALECHGAGAKVAIFPNGSRVIPIVRRGRVHPSP